MHCHYCNATPADNVIAIAIVIGILIVYPIVWFGVAAWLAGRKRCR